MIILRRGECTSAKLRKLAYYVCHSCESRNPAKSMDSRLKYAGMTEPELMQVCASSSLTGLAIDARPMKECVSVGKELHKGLREGRT